MPIVEKIDYFNEDYALTSDLNKQVRTDTKPYLIEFAGAHSALIGIGFIGGITGIELVKGVKPDTSEQDSQLVLLSNVCNSPNNTVLENNGLNLETACSAETIEAIQAEKTEIIDAADFHPNLAILTATGSIALGVAAFYKLMKRKSLKRIYTSAEKLNIPESQVQIVSTFMGIYSVQKPIIGTPHMSD